MHKIPISYLHSENISQEQFRHMHESIPGKNNENDSLKHLPILIPNASDFSIPWNNITLYFAGVSATSKWILFLTVLNISYQVTGTADIEMSIFKKLYN